MDAEMFYSKLENRSLEIVKKFFLDNFFSTIVSG